MPHDLAVITNIEAEREAQKYVPLVEVAATIGVEPTTVRRWIWKGDVHARERSEGRGCEVNVTTLPAKYQALFIARTTPPRPVLRAAAGDEAVSRYAAAPRASVRERAELRLEALLSFRKARAKRAQGETFAAVEGRWLRNFRRTHPDMKVSIRSVKAWSAAYRDGGNSIDVLVDGNDGTKQRGSRIPALAKQMFRDEYLRQHRPNLRLCYDNVLAVAAIKEWGPMPSYDTFWRYAKTIPKMVRKLRRECANNARTVLPYVRRDPTSLRAFDTIQSDIRELDVAVRCDNGCSVCTGTKPKGHFPKWTAFVDIRSRRVLGSDLSIDTPTSHLILEVFRRVVNENGLPNRVYIDNGANYVKGFGRCLRREGRTEWDGPNEEQMQARFAPIGVDVTYALPYNAQAKLIERMFRTFRHRFDENFEAYRGQLGRKSELAGELFYRPKELPTISELAYLLQLSITEYNALIPHGGRGMDGRTPDAVFYDESLRIPRRVPDAAWGLLFFDRVKGGRVVGQNGIQHEGRIYRLTSLHKHLEYFGERVDFRPDPDDRTSAIILDRATGAFVCNAKVDPEDATYSSRDEVTRRLIGRVFSDNKELKRMAATYVEGAKERFADYRRAKIEYVLRRFAELEAERGKTGTGSTVVAIGQFSTVARQSVASAPTEVTATMLETVLDADDAAAQSLCVVSPRREKKIRIRTNLRDDELSYGTIANKLGISRRTLDRYRKGQLAWPAGMQDRFEAIERLRGGSATSADAAQRATLLSEPPKRPRRKRSDGELSWSSIAATLGISLKRLLQCRTGKRPWPEGVKERFDELERRRET
jgi:hypothetical protein